jgi:hypothetical protein
MPKRRGRRVARGAVARRWIAVGALVLVALLYYRPVRAYMEARGTLSEKSATVHRLRAERDGLERRLQASSTLAVLAREARALGYVRQGEHLFIVKGIAQWRKRERAGNAPRRGH